MSRDTYEDVAHLQSKPLGVLGGEGTDFLEKVTTELKPEGIVTQCACNMCSSRCQILVPYEEAVIGSVGYIPPGWQFDEGQGALYPNVGCTGCKYLVQLFFTPQELKSHVRRAVEQGYYSQGAAQAVLSRLPRR